MNYKVVFLFLLLFAGCTSRDKSLQKELDNSSENAKTFSRLMAMPDEEAATLTDKQLVDLADNLYTNVGGLAYYKEDSLKLEKALRFLDIAINKNPKNEAAMLSKVNVYCSLKEYSRAITTINGLFEIKGEYPEGLMFEGMLYEKINKLDSSAYFYQEALNAYNSRILKDNKLNDKVNRAVLYCLVKNREAGLAEINKLISENPQDEFAKQVKIGVIENFKRDVFIKNNIEP
ncbi:MAG TPA: hypothetical protein VMW01_04925 [Williamwhitmania sp.]|nr:hypothetical protein [Williamwhitmania sp.]